ncbi:MAG: protein phosphatase 2C domain-containing protein [Anaerolineae bacterium]|nr:protein phosphatase 2C domain-containing protein [Anaerolineae bacterium]
MLNKFIKGLLGKNDDLEKSQDTNPLYTLEEFGDIPASTEALSINPPQIISGSSQSVGKLRDHNEDTLFALTSVFSDGESQLPFGIFIVADGMGGHQYGEVASRYATRAVADYLMIKLFSPIMGLQNESSGESLVEILEHAIDRAQQIVVSKAPGGGTTLSVAVVIGSQVTLAHVGDSRVYFGYEDGRFEPITHDHTYVGHLIEQGHLTREEAENHPKRNILYRAIGQAEPFKPDIQTIQFPDNGFMLMCSDGLWGVVPHAEIYKTIHSTLELPTACHLLTESANRLGGPDNISVILVKQVR